jgi:hypothetical protein
MRSFGRALQMFAMIILPLGMVLEFTGGFSSRPFGVANLLIVMCFGIACFGIGRIIEGYGSKGE